MGPNIWREEHEWPLARTRYAPLYLSSRRHANSVEGDGSLSWYAVSKQPSDQFTYDPKNPVPTIGGAHLLRSESDAARPARSDPRSKAAKMSWCTRQLRSPEDVEVTGPFG